MFVTMKLRVLAVSCLLAVIAFGAPSVEAQARRIEFARGTSSKTVAGTVRNSRPVCWSFNAAEGQRASFTLKGSGAYGAFLPADWDGGTTGALQLGVMDSRLTRDVYEIELDGDNTVCVATSRKSVAYRLTLTIV
jgi:hypothetical protein